MALAECQRSASFISAISTRVMTRFAMCIYVPLQELGAMLITSATKKSRRYTHVRTHVNIHVRRERERERERRERDGAHVEIKIHDICAYTHCTR